MIAILSDYSYVAFLHRVGTSDRNYALRADLIENNGNPGFLETTLFLIHTTTRTTVVSVNTYKFILNIYVNV